MSEPVSKNGSMDDLGRARMFRGFYENAAAAPPHEGVATDMANLGLALDTYELVTDEDAKRLYKEIFVVAARRLRTMRKIFSKGYLVTVAGARAEVFERNLTTTIERLEAIVPSES